jgi:hypothetical protein
LADEVLEGLRAILAGEDEVAHDVAIAYNARRRDASRGGARRRTPRTRPNPLPAGS